jgi:D-glycero-D-manno-heptose 1,7-bisphosphate phosphatase
MSAGALFLDRDGVINVDSGYVGRREDFHWIDGIFDTVRFASSLGLACIVATNQAGIARGYYSEADFHALTDWMLQQFAEQGAPLKAVYYCPYHPDGIGQYRHADHPDRKPNPGMLLRAASEWGLDLAASALVGDKDIDVLAATRAGIGYIAKFGVPGAETGPAVSVVPTHAEVRTWLARIAAPGGGAR